MLNKKFFVFIFSLLMTPALYAANYYVSLTGNDGNSGTLSLPFRSIAKGLSVLRAGDTLYLRGGTYAEVIDSNSQQIPTGTSWTSAVTIMAYPGESVVLKPVGGGYIIGLSHNYIKYVIIDGLIVDGSTLSRPTTANGGGIVNISLWGGANHVRIKNCEIRNSPSQGITIYPGNGYSSDYNELINCKIYNNGITDFDHGIYLNTNNNLIEGNEFYNNTGWGVHKYPAGNNNIIRNNRIHNNASIGKRGPGISIYGGSGNQVYNNVIWSNQYGITLDYGETGAKVYNNTIFKNYASCIQNGPGASNSSIVNNICWRNSVAVENLGSILTSTNNLSTDPKFANETTFDLRLQSTSPAINTGKTVSEVINDILGAARPSGSAYDIGAYEYGGAPAPAPTPTPTPPAPTPLPTPTPTASTITVSPTSVQVGATVTVSVQNKSMQTTDWVGLFASGAADSNYISWVYLNGLKTAPAQAMASANLSFQMATAGNYEFRFFQGASTLLAKSSTLSVTAAAPAPAPAPAPVPAPSPSPTAAFTTTMKAENSGKCVDFTTSTADRIKLIQRTCSGAANQSFAFYSKGSGYYEIRASHSGKCITHLDSNTADGASLVQMPCSGDTNQQFRLEDKGGGKQKIHSKVNDKCMDVSGISTADDAEVFLWTCWYGTNENFFMSTSTTQPPPPAPAPAPSPSPGTTSTYQASVDFNTGRGFSYTTSKGEAMTYYSPWGVMKAASETYLMIARNYMHPGNAADAVLRFTAPASGNLVITGRIYDTDSSCGATGSTSGVVVSVKKNTTLLQQNNIINGDSTGINLNLSVPVVAGDKIDFIVNNRGDWACDSTFMDPKIVLTTN